MRPGKAPSAHDLLTGGLQLRFSLNFHHQKWQSWVVILPCYAIALPDALDNAIATMVMSLPDNGSQQTNSASVGAIEDRRPLILRAGRAVDYREERVSLATLFEQKFRGDIRFRGAAYLEAERVAVTRVLPDHIFAVVRDGDEFQTQLTRNNGELKMFCTCVGDAKTKQPACKHLWATLLAVDAGGYLSGHPVDGRIPPFVARVPVEIADDIEEDAFDTGDVYHPRTRSTLGVVELPVPKRSLREWESRLEELRQQFSPTSTKSKQAERERDILYEIDLSESRETNQLIIQTSQRQRRTNGQWGKLKPLKLRPGKLEDIESVEDRRILAYLVGATPERSGWLAQQSEFQTSTYRYTVPFELAELLIPMMCATQRLRFQGDTEGTFQPLQWDDGPAWSLALVVDRSDETGGWHVRGELHREGQTLCTEDVELLVPGGLVITRTQIARLNDYDAFDWIPLLTGSRPLNAPEEEGQELVDMLLDMPTLPELVLPKELRLEEVRVRPIPRLRIRSPRSQGWKHDRLQGFVEFDYLGTVVSASSVRWAIVQREHNRCIIRDREFETACWTLLTDLGFRRLLDQYKHQRDVDIPAAELARAVRRLIEEQWEVTADDREIRQPGAIRFQVQSGIDWFELSAEIDFEGRRVSLPELLATIRRGDGTIRLDDGSLGLLPEEWLEKYGILAGLGTKEEDHLRFTTSQAVLLDVLLAEQPHVDVDEQFAAIRQRMQNFQGVEEASEPEGFQGELRTYQREGLGWLRFLQEFHFGGCLADDMGLGKTVQLLALLQDRIRHRKEKLPSLIVVPKSLMFNWTQEIERFTPELKSVEYAGLERHALRESLAKQDIVLTTYGTLRRDISELKDIPFDYAVLDEAQTIKNASSQVAKACRLLRAKHRLALSGTPIENHLGDLWSIFEFLNPGMLGQSSAFKLSVRDAKDQEARQVLSRGLKPFVLRRTKSQVASELPDRMEETIFCQMEDRQQQLYNELRDHYREALLGIIEKEGMGKSKMHVLEALLRLRQAACHPALLDKDSEDEPFAKLAYLCPQLEELIEEGHKSLVFSQFTSMLSIVKKHLDARGITYAYLDGKTRGRKAVVERFQNDPDCPVFLISLKAGGLGLNLTAAEYVFLLDPWWNPAVEAQAIDRAHRVGQTRHVFAYRLICQGTVEEKILELQQKKRDLADAILEADNRLLKDLSPEDLEMLLS